MTRGPDGKKVYDKVNKDAACYYSVLINKELGNKEWPATEVQEYEMECSRSVLIYFMQFIHRNKLNNIPETTLKNKGKALAIGTDAVHLWILADRHFIPGLKNRALHILHYIMGRRELSEVMGRIFEQEQEFVWKNTEKKSKLRVFLMDWMSTCDDYEVPREISSKWDVGLWQEMYEHARKMLQTKTGRQVLTWYYSPVPEQGRDGTLESE